MNSIQKYVLNSNEKAIYRRIRQRDYGKHRKTV